MNHEHIEQDREPTDAEYEAITDCNMEAANVLLDKLLPIFDQADENHGGYGDLAYALWIELTCWLAVTGWRPDKLAEDAGYFAAKATTEGEA